MVVEGHPCDCLAQHGSGVQLLARPYLLCQDIQHGLEPKVGVFRGVRAHGSPLEAIDPPAFCQGNVSFCERIRLTLCVVTHYDRPERGARRTNSALPASRKPEVSPLRSIGRRSGPCRRLPLLRWWDRNARGSISRVNPYFSIFSRVLCLTSANTREIPCAFSSTSRSSKHVRGGGVHVRDRLGRDDDPPRFGFGSCQVPDVVAERPDVGEEQRGVPPVDHQAGQVLRVRVDADVVKPLDSRAPARSRSRTATTPGGRCSGWTAPPQCRCRAGRPGTPPQGRRPCTGRTRFASGARAAPFRECRRGRSTPSSPRPPGPAVAGSGTAPATAPA